MKQTLTRKQDVIFLALTITLLSFVILYVALSISFLARRLESALFEKPSDAPLITHFNFDKVDQVLKTRVQ